MTGLSQLEAESLAEAELEVQAETAAEVEDNFTTLGGGFGGIPGCSCTQTPPVGLPPLPPLTPCDCLPASTPPPVPGPAGSLT
jgi:hypothetical protein